MAAKRILKFFLKLLVAAGIVVGGFFGVKALINTKNKNSMIYNNSISLGLSNRVLNSSSGLINKSEKYNTNVKLNVLTEINKVLIEYYNHYISLTAFENHPNDSQRDQIISKMNDLSNKINSTINSLAFIDTSASNSIKEQRIVYSANLYIEQTKVLFELDEILKDYVYKVNYSVNVSGNTYESQLEMIKDYSKTVFNVAIDNQMANNELNVMLVGSNNKTDFINVLSKFNSRQKYNVNGDEEVYFSWYYMNISKTQLNEFYKLNETDKNNYKYSLSTETERNQFICLFKYLSRTSF